MFPLGKCLHRMEVNSTLAHRRRLMPALALARNYTRKKVKSIYGEEHGKHFTHPSFACDKSVMRALFRPYLSRLRPLLMDCDEDTSSLLVGRVLSLAGRS